MSTEMINWSALTNSSRTMRMVFSEPEYRPPVLNEMMPDLEKLIHSAAQKYNDRRTVCLNYEEIVGEGHLKLAEILTAGHIEKQKTRLDFFKFFAACLNNKVRSLVQRHRFTEKRTGAKPPPKEDRTYTTSLAFNDHAEHEHSDFHKNVDVSLDDPDTGVYAVAHSSDDEEMKALVDEYTPMLNKAEQIVFAQMMSPNAEALNLAYMDAARTRKPNQPLKIEVKPVHLAEGIGLTLDWYEKIVLRVRYKVTEYRSMTPKDQKERIEFNTKVSQLKDLFGLQIPATCDVTTIRRLLSVAARDQIEKVNDQVKEILKELNVPLPKINVDGKMNCWGVLFSYGERVCRICGYRDSCKAEVSSLNLDKIVLSKHLIGKNMFRSPILLPQVEGEPAQTSMFDSRDAEIIGYLDETLTQYKKKDKIMYGQETGRKQEMLFCLENAQSPVMLRFCTPSENLKLRLVQSKKGWYPLDTAEVVDVINLIDQHIAEHLNPDELSNQLGSTDQDPE